MDFAILLQTIFFVIALCLDSFAAAFAYGTNKIKIPFASASVISIICSAILGISLLIGTLIRDILPGNLPVIICFCMLFILGLVKLFDSIIKGYIRKNEKIHKQLCFSIFSLKFILNIYANPEIADKDHSRVLSIKEAVYLSVAMSLDGLVAGIGAALKEINIFLAVSISLIIVFISIVSGCFLGNKLAKKTPLDFSWLGGVILIILAFLKLS